MLARMLSMLEAHLLIVVVLIRLIVYYYYLKDICSIFVPALFKDILLNKKPNKNIWKILKFFQCAIGMRINVT